MSKKGISRRDFIKGTAAGAVGVAAMGVLGACSTGSNGDEIAWDKESDVVIVGGGGTGLAAAAQASADGAAVLVLEKSGVAGGTTTYSGGVMQAAGTAAQKELTSYQDDTPEKHADYWLAAGEGYVDEELVKDLAQGAPDHIQWFSDLGLKWTRVYGYSRVPYIDDSLYAYRIHTYEGGGAEAGGAIMVQAMLSAAQANGAVVEYETEVTNLITNADGEVIGVKAMQDGAEINVKAKKGVILAAASIDQNVELAQRLSPQQHWDLTSQVCLCAQTNTGQGITMAMEIGADVAGFGGTIDFCGKYYAAVDDALPNFPSFIVNKKGRRFVCEDATYAYHYRAIFQQEKQFNGPTYLVFGESALTSVGCTARGMTADALAQDVADGVLIKADTIEALAEMISVDPANLAATLSKWNADMAAGSDNQFDRTTGLETISGPFYAYKNVAFNLGALGGVRINAETEVLKPDGTPIPRLYAGGLNAGGWIGPYYPGSGTAIIGTVHWGRKAGANAAKLESL